MDRTSYGYVNVYIFYFGVTETKHDLVKKVPYRKSSIKDYSKEI